MYPNVSPYSSSSSDSAHHSFCTPEHFLHGCQEGAGPGKTPDVDANTEFRVTEQGCSGLLFLAEVLYSTGGGWQELDCKSWCHSPLRQNYIYTHRHPLSDGGNQ